MTIQTTFVVQVGHSISVQWYKDGVALVDGTYGGITVSGATDSFVSSQTENTIYLTITDPTADYDGDYSVILTDETADCEVESNVVDVFIPICRIAIATQPVDVTTDAGSEVELSLTYSGNVGNITIQWYKDAVALVDGATGSGSTISGATSDNLVITNAQESDSGSYYAIVTDDAYVDCFVQTNTVTVDISSACAIEITTQPEGGDYDVGDEIVMTVAYSGEIGPVTFQWFLDGNPLVDGPSGDATISGATTDTLTIANSQEAQTGAYTVQLTDTGEADCTTQSTVAEVSVTEPEPPENMYIWYKADAESFSDGDVAFPIQDWAGYNLDLTRSGNSAPNIWPLFETNELNGLPIFYWPGPIGTGNDANALSYNGAFNLVSLGFPVTTTGFTFAVVINRMTSNPNFNTINPANMRDGSGGAPVVALVSVVADPDVTYRIDATSSSSAEVTVPIDTWQIITCSFDFTEGIPRIQSNDDTDVGAVTDPESYNLNFAMMQLAAEGGIAEMLYYNTKLSDADLEQLRHYLSVKWDIAITV